MPLDIQRHMALWHSEPTDRPVLTFWVGSYYPLEQYPSLARSLSHEYLKPSDIDIPLLLNDYERLQDLYSHIGDDATFVVTPLAGFPWLEAILGCPIRVSGASFWAKPYLKDWSILDKVSMTIHAGWWDKLHELVLELSNRYAGSYPVTVPLLRGTTDLLASVRGHSQFPLDFYDYPNEVEQFLAISSDLWDRLTRSLLHSIPPYQDGYFSPAFSVWAPEQIIVMQQDATALLSPRIYRSVILPDDRRRSASYPYSIFHCHPASAHILEDLLALPQVSAIELNYESGGPTLDTMISWWQHIQRVKPLIVWGEFSGDDLSRIVTSLNPQGLALHIVAPTTESVFKMTDLVQRLSVQPRSR